MAIVASGAVAIKDDTLQAGSTSIALEVDGNTIGDKDLATLGSTAGLNTGGTSMTEFYGYSSVTIPNAPTNGDAQDILGQYIEVTWTDNSNDETAFYIYREVDQSGGFIYYDFVGANVTTFNDENVEDLVYYQYQIYAYNSAGLSAAFTETPLVLFNP